MPLLTETEPIEVIPSLLDSLRHRVLVVEAALMAHSGQMLGIERVEPVHDFMNAVGKEGSLQRPCTGVVESELVRIQHFCFACALSAEEMLDGLVEVAVEDRLETAFGCVELLYWTISFTSHF